MARIARISLSPPFQTPSWTVVIVASIFLGFQFLTVQSKSNGVSGPQFDQEPPSSMEFSNSTGARIPCTATGNPPPEVRWVTGDGSAVIPVVGLREVLSDGTLVLDKFKAEDFRQDVHATAYKCTASNPTGTIASREVHVKAVTVQPFDLYVYDVYVIKGNTAVLKCHVPNFLTDYVTVVSWIRDGAFTIQAEDIEKDGKYAILPSGELLIRQAQSADASTSYRCKAKHRLTGESKISVSNGRLFVTEPAGNVPPRILSHQPSLWAREGEAVTIPCVANAHPLADIRWSISLDGNVSPVPRNGRFVPVQGALLVKDLRPADSARYICEAANAAGSEKAETALTVTGPLLVTLSPAKLVVDAGDSSSFTCDVSGYPVKKITWLKDGKTHLPEGVTSTKSGSVLQVVGGNPSLKGMYQCVVANDYDNVQAAAELRLGDTPPEVVSTFDEQILNPGATLSLSCVATGTPLPYITWLLDDTLLAKDKMDQETIDESRVSSKLTISNVRAEDGGVYTCLATNKAGNSVHLARIHVYGKLSSRARPKTSVVSGDTVWVNCPVYGAPIDSITWEKGDETLPANLRQTVLRNGTLRLQNVQRGRDSGRYTCLARNSKGESTKGNVEVVVMVPPKLTPFSFQDDLVREGSRARVHCVVSEGDLPLSIKWLKDGESLKTSDGISVLDLDEFSSILTISSISPRHNGNYTCVASNQAATTSHSAVLAVNVAPKIVPFSFQDDHVFEGVLARISCVVYQGDLPISISWFKDNEPVVTDPEIKVRVIDEYSSILTIESAQTRHTGNYTCVAKNSAAAVTHTAQLLINVPPHWVVKPQDSSALIGDDITLNCLADGFPKPTVQWMKARGNDPNDERMPVFTNGQAHILPNGSLQIRQVSEASEGYYFCLASNGIGDGLSKATYLKIHGPAKFITKQKNQSAIISKDVRLECEATGDLPINFTWSVNNKIIDTHRKQRYKTRSKENATEDSAVSELVITKVNRNDSKIFACTAQNPYGSDTLRIKLVVLEPPDSPTIVAVATGNGTVAVTWKTTYDGNSAIQRLLLQHKEVKDDWKNAKNVSLSSPSGTALLKALIPNSLHVARIQAINEVGRSNFSSEATFRTDEEAPTGPPLNVEVEPVDKQSLRITWHPPQKDLWNGIIRGYYLGYKVSDSLGNYTFASIEIPEDYTDDLIYQLTDLQMYTQYKIIVKAYNSKGPGPSSEGIVVMTSEDVPHHAPQNVRCSSLSTQTIYVIWDAMLPENVNGILRGYKVLFKPADEWYDAAYHSKTTLSPKFTLQNLEVNTNYSIQVLAFTKVGDGIKSKPIFCKTHEDVPSAPGDIKVLPAAVDTVIVAWKPPVKPNGAVTKYNVYVRPIDDDEEIGPETRYSKDAVTRTDNLDDTNIHTSRDDLVYEITGLEKGRRYEFWVTAVSVVGEGPRSRVLAQQTAATTVAAQSASFDDIIKTPWKRDLSMPCRGVGNPDPIKQWLKSGKPIHLHDRLEIAPDGALIIKKTQLEDRGNYTCTIRNKFGNDEVHYAVMVLVPPAAPNIGVYSKTMSSLQLKWQQGMTGGDPIRGYILFYKKESDDWSKKELAPEHDSFILENLACGATYQLYMEAFNHVGIGDSSDTITITTDGDALEPPPKDQIIREGATFLSLHLDAWPSHGCPIQHFAAEYRRADNATWKVIAKEAKPSQKRLVIPGLVPGTWYHVRVTAHTSGEPTVAEYVCATLTQTGATVSPNYSPEHREERIIWLSLDWILILASIILAILLVVIMVAMVCLRRRQAHRKRPLARKAMHASVESFVHLQGNNPANQRVYASLARGTMRSDVDPNPYATSTLPGCTPPEGRGGGRFSGPVGPHSGRSDMSWMDPASRPLSDVTGSYPPSMSPAWTVYTNDTAPTKPLSKSSTGSQSMDVKDIQSRPLPPTPQRGGQSPHKSTQETMFVVPDDSTLDNRNSRSSRRLTSFGKSSEFWSGRMEASVGRAAQMLPLLAFLCACSLLTGVAGQQELSPPSFATTPPHLVEFSNTTGTKIPCSASNPSTSVKVSWLSSDGSDLLPIPGLREILPDGTLVLPPFRAEHFRQDVHATSYKCALTSTLGTIVSNDVVVKGVVLQPYDVYVYDVFTMRGSNAVVKCHIPKVISSYVTVTSWIRDSVTVISANGFNNGDRYRVIPSGELYIRDVTTSDGRSTFHCEVTNKLTGEAKRSLTAAKLFVTDPQGNVPPKITFNKKVIQVIQGENAFLPCEGQGHPLSTIRWTVRTESGQQQDILINDRNSLVSGSLLIKTVQHSDSGIYTCISTNVAGSDKVETHLIVNDHLSVHMEPRRLVVDDGKPAIIRCEVSGNPMTSVTLMKDGKSLSQIQSIEIHNNNTIRIASVSKDHKGLYQCFAKNDVEESFAVAMLALGDSPPLLVSGFEERILQPGPSINLRCTFSGNPIPDIVWQLDGQAISPELRQSRSQDGDGNVISTISIRNIRSEDGGVYACKAENKAGKTIHKARVNVYGKIGSRQSSGINVVSGETITMSCPFYGYPFSGVKWMKEDQTLPSNVRQFPKQDGTLTIQNVHKIDDSGDYTCSVKQSQHSILSEVRLTVMVPPKLAPFSFQDELVREGMRGRLQCVVLEGDLPITLGWLKDGQPISPSLATVRAIDEFSSILTITSISPRHNGNYTCSAKNPAAVTTYTTQLAVNVPPKILPFAFQDDQFFKGMRAHIICAVSQGDSPLQFHWLKDNAPIPPTLGVLTRSYDGHANSLSIESVSSKHTGNYTCVVSNKAATVSHTAQLLVHVAPKIIPFSFQESGVMEGVLARVSCVVYQGDLPIKINWLKDGTSVSSVPGISVRTIDDYSSILTIETTGSYHAGNYTCLASNAASTVAQSSLLQVNVPPKIVPFSFQDEHLVEGMLVRVSCVVSRGDLPLTITWLKDGHPVPAHLSVSIRDFDEYSSVLSIDPITSNHSGNYTCIARNNAASDSQTAQLKVQVRPKWEVQPQHTTARSGDTVYLHCKATGLPTPTISWTWTKEDDNENRASVKSNDNTLLLKNGTIMLKNLSKTNEGLYFCTASNGVGQSLSKSMILKVLAPPYFKDNLKTSVGKKGQNLTIVCAAFGDLPIRFSWSIDNAIINAAKDTRYLIKNCNSTNGETSAQTEMTITWLARKDSAKYKCKAENEYGIAEMMHDVIVQELPDAPVTDDAKEGNRSVSLSWKLSYDGNSPVTNFLVQYKKQTDNWQIRTMNITIPGDVTSAVLSGLLPSTIYNFRVAARNAIGLGMFSNVIAGTTQEDVPSGAPLNVEVESTDQHTLRVTWKPPRKSQWNGPIRGYNIGFKVEGSSDPFEFRNLEVPEDYTEDLIFQLTDLKMFTQYNVVVNAYNNRGSGPDSSSVVAMTSEDVPGSPPVGVRCSALSSKSIYILWDPPSSENVNGIIRGFKVIYKPVSEWYDSALRVKVSHTAKITLQELDVNTNYTIQVLAFTKVGDGVKSSPVFCKTHEDVPESPQEIKVLPSSSDSVVVAWKSPKNSNGGITKYNVYYKPMMQGQEVDPISDAGDAVALMTEQVNQDPDSHTSRSDNQYLEVKGLKKNKKYAFWVTASSVIGEGPSSKVMAQTVADSTVPAKSASFDGTIKTPWKRDVVMPCKAVGVPAPQRKWMLGDRPLEVSGRNILLSDGTLLINKVSTDDSGNYTCVMYNEHGKDDVQYCLLVQVPPAAPLLDVVSKHRSSIQLQWKPGPDGGDKLKGYILHFRPGTGTWESNELGPDRHLFTLDNLACGTSYQVYLEAFNSIGTGPACDVITVATDGSELVTPTKDSLLREGSTFVTIHLEAWPSNGCPIEKYQVEYKQLYGHEWTVVSDSLRPTQKKLVIPGLTPATWYSMRLTAVTNGKNNVVEYKFSTLTPAGGTIPPPDIRIDQNPEPVYLFYLDPYIFIPTVALLIVVIIASVVICVCVKRKTGSMGSPSDSDTTINTWSRSMHRGSHGNSQYPTMSRGGKDPNPYATARLPDCILQHPCSDAFLGPSWGGTLGRRPIHLAQSGPGVSHGHQNEWIQQAPNVGASTGMQETTFVFPGSNQTGFTPSKGNLRPDLDYDQPPVGI